MKRLLIGDRREKLLCTLEVILKHWGYRVLVSSRAEEFEEFVEESSPDLLIVGAGLILESRPSLQEKIRLKLKGKCRLIVLGEEDARDTFDLHHESLQVPLDLFSLFAVIQKHLEKFPRKYLRLSTQLPGLLCRGDSCHLTEVLSLSRQGLFIKTSLRVEPGEDIQVAVSLLGMKQEIELRGRVLYRVHPDPENNYLQGIGIEFTNMEEEKLQALDAFIQNRFLGDLSNQKNAGGLATDQLLSCGPLTFRVT